MSTEDYGQFTCEFCGKPYPWKPQFAGKKVRCQCGEVMVAPSQPPAPPQAGNDDAGEYDLADDPKPAKPASKAGMPMVQRSTPAKPVPDSNDDLDLAPVPVAAGASKPRPAGTRITSAPTNPMLAYQSTAKSREEKKDYGSDFANQIGGEVWREIYVPGGLMILGLVLNIVLFIRMSGGNATIGEVMLPLGLTLLLNLILSFIGILLVSKWFEIGFGHPAPAVLKLSSVILIPSALAGFAALVIGSADAWTMMGVRLAIVMPLTAIGLVVLFGIALDEAFYCMTVIYLVTQWATLFLVGAIASGSERTGAAAAMVLQAGSGPSEDDGDGPKSQTPWVMGQIAEGNTQDALTYLKPGDRTLGSLPPVQAIQLVQSFKDAGATEVLVNLPNTYRGYTLFIGLPADEQKRTALIDLYRKTCEQLNREAEDVFPKDKYLILRISGGLVDDTVPVMPDGSPDDRPMDVRNREKKLREQQQQK